MLRSRITFQIITKKEKTQEKHVEKKKKMRNLIDRMTMTDIKSFASEIRVPSSVKMSTHPSK